MKLYSFTFKNFASFDSQEWVSSPGLAILAGRNNAGKTALLRALSCTPALSHKPNRRRQGFEYLLQYCRRAPEPQPSFGITVRFTYESADAPPIQIEDVDWNTALRGGGPAPTLDFELEFFPGEGAVTITDAKLSIGKHRYSLLLFQGNSASRRMYQYPSEAPVGTVAVQWSSYSNINGVPVFDFTDAFFSPLHQLNREVKLVSAHRVPTPQCN